MTKYISTTNLRSITDLINTDSLKHFKSFVLFVGHAHSGHSIIAAILDAHHDIAIANEINIPKLILDHSEITKEQLLKLTLYYSLQENKEWLNTEYRNNISESFQGKTKFPVVLGDKKGGGGTRIIMKNPQILNKLLGILEDKLKIIHVFRDPIENISSFAYYWQEPLGSQHVDRYIENYETTLQIKQKIKEENWCSVDQKEFIRNPVEVLANLFSFLGVTYTNDQLESYTSIVKNNIPSKSNLFKFENSMINEINERIKEVNLKYSF